MLDLLFPYQIYCERGTSLDFLAEPITAVTNLIIIITAYFVFKLLKQHGKLNTPFILFPVFLFFAGVGSLLWHTIPNQVTLLIDSITVICLLLAIALVYFKQIFGSYSKSLFVAIIGTTVAVIPLLFITEPSATFRNLLSLTVFLIITVIGYFRHGKVILGIITPALILMVSIIFREIDMAICNIIPFGTHALWHVFNSLATYLFVVFLIKLESSVERNS